MKTEHTEAKTVTAPSVGSGDLLGPFDRVSQLKPHVGKRVTWEYAHDYHRGTCLVNRGVLERIEGRNLVVGGDYIWFGNVKGTLRVVA